MARLLVCGSRTWTDRDLLFEALDSYDVLEDLVDVVIEGEARGADLLSAAWAKSRGIDLLRFPANWEKYGLRAGPVRNHQMLVEGQPTLVVAFHDQLQKSKGTRNCVGQAHRMGIPVRIHTHAQPYGRNWPSA